MSIVTNVSHNLGLMKRVDLIDAEIHRTEEKIFVLARLAKASEEGARQNPLDQGNQMMKEYLAALESEYKQQLELLKVIRQSMNESLQAGQKMAAGENKLIFGNNFLS